MSEKEAVEKGLRLVPSWMPVFIAIVSGVFSAGASYATMGSRLSDAEHRMQAIEADRDSATRDLNQFKTEIARDLAGIKTDIGWIRRSMEQTR